MKTEAVKPTISATTRLSRALDLHPNVLEYIVSLNPHEFDRLENPLMRKLMAPRITLERVAVMTGTPVQTLLARVAELGGAVAGFGESALSKLPESPQQRPEWVSSANPASTRTVNLLPLDEALSGDPMPPVMLELKKLQPGETLLIRHKWEPQPFYDVWAKMPGLEWFSEVVNDNEWHIWVRRV